jgi:hypothetical protein
LSFDFSVEFCFHNRENLKQKEKKETMSRVLAVPVVAHELRAQESYLQTIDALDNLNKGK